MKKWILLFLIPVALVAIFYYIQFGKAVVVPNPAIKTVEFVIGQDTTQLASAAAKAYTFSFYIPESSPVKRYAWIEIRGVSTATDNSIAVNVNGANVNTYSLDSAGETQQFIVRYPFYLSISQGNNGPYTLNVKATGAITSVESAKLVLTYEYDSTSTRQLRTVRYFVGQNGTAMATGVGVPFPFSVQIPESGTINIRSAFLEVEGVSNGAADNALAVDINGADAISASLDSSVATQAFTILYNATALYSITSSGTYSYTANVKGTGTITSVWGARAVVTYEYDSSASTQQRTVRYLVASDNTTVASAANKAYTFTVPIAESDITIKSAFVKVNGWITAVDASAAAVDIGDTNIKSHVIDINTEGGEFTILYNATQLYSMTGETTNGPYTLNVKITGPATTLEMAELYLTYNYPSSATTQMKTVEHGPFNDKAQRVAANGVDDLFFIITPESGVNSKSVYMESSSVTSATAAHTLTVGTEGTTRGYTQGNSGETTLDYILHNATNDIYSISQGLNGAFLGFKSDSAIASLMGGNVVTTYFFLG
jgi:hypothetical protein